MGTLSESGRGLSILELARALASERRFPILEWLKDSAAARFPPQVDGDLTNDGVCVEFITKKLAVSQPTATEHLKVLSHCGRLRPFPLAVVEIVVEAAAKAALLVSPALCW